MAERYDVFLSYAHADAAQPVIRLHIGSLWLGPISMGTRRA